MNIITITSKDNFKSPPTKRVGTSFLALTLFCMSLPCMAQRAVTLDDCLRIATENNLTLKSGRIAVERAKDLQGTAFDLDKTSISLSQDPTGGGSPDNALTFSQTFAFPTLYGTKRKALREETSLEAKRLDMTRNELQKAVAKEYYNLLYELERRRILTRQAALYRRFQFLADAKLKYGEAGKLEWMNAKRLNRENEIALKNIERDVETATVRLQQWLNTGEKLTPQDTALTAIAITDDELNAFNAAATPLGAVLSQQQKVADQNVKVARQGFLPDISVAASAQLLIKGWNPYDVDRSRFEKGNFMGFEVGLSVPLFYGGQRARLKAAKHDAEIAKTQTAERLSDLRRQYIEARNEFLKARASLDYYQKQGASEADEIERISQEAYEKGAISYIEYIQNLQTAVDIHNSHATAVNDFNQAAINIKYLNGTNNK